MRPSPWSWKVVCRDLVLSPQQSVQSNSTWHLVKCNYCRCFLIYFSEDKQNSIWMNSYVNGIFLMKSGIWVCVSHAQTASCSKLIVNGTLDKKGVPFIESTIYDQKACHNSTTVLRNGPLPAWHSIACTHKPLRHKRWLSFCCIRPPVLYLQTGNLFLVTLSSVSYSVQLSALHHNFKAGQGHL